MPAARKARVPRALLILCEGKTEEAYFNILLDVFRVPWYVNVEVHGQRGQHLTLVDNAVKRRGEICTEYGFMEEEVECWAVCDEDIMPVMYSELERYAEERQVHLAFSAPQFEMYLLQHFEQSGSTDRAKVFQGLSKYRQEYGGEGAYNDSTKSDLSWLGEAIDRKPKIVETAITNSDMRLKASKRPYFTVQNLTKRIKKLAL